MLSRPRYGLPPPPVPSTQAPTASDSMSSAVMSRKLTRWSSREHALEVDVVAERPRTHMLQTLGRQEDGRRRQGNHGDPLAVADGLGADCLTRHRVEHADQVGRHGDGLLVEPGHDPFVLKVDL